MCRPSVFRTVLALSGVLVAPSAVGAEQTGVPALAGDSVDVRDQAERAQRRFEHLRIRHLPRRTSGGIGPCDDYVGRMCWHHDTGGYWRPDPEDPAVVEGRDSLLVVLATAHDRIPGDGWVLGQLVWYLGEAGRWSEAEGAASSCEGAESWWCLALEGLAHHAQGRYDVAEEAFEQALHRMEPERAKRWTELDVVADGDAARTVEDDVSGEAWRVFWLLADPLFLVAGNDRLTEHYARWTVSRIREDAYNPHGLTWAGDLEELLVRYGWAVGWERELSRISVSEPDGVVGHEHPAARAFLPSASLLREPLEADRDDWIARQHFRPSAYAPLHAPILLPASSDVSVFPGRDEIRVVATFQMPEDTTYRTREDRRLPHVLPSALGGVGIEGGLFLAPLPKTVAGADRPGVGERVTPRSGTHLSTLEARRTGRASGALLLSAPPGRYILSSEVWDPSTGLAGRYRTGIALETVEPDVLAVSDLLLMTGGPEPSSLEAALDRVLTTLDLRSGQRLRVAWEVSGAAAAEPEGREALAYSLVLGRADRGLLQRIGEGLGLVEGDRPDRLSWRERAPGTSAPSLRSVAMELPALEPGAYTLRLEVTAAGRSTVVAEREIRIVQGVAGGS